MTRRSSLFYICRMLPFKFDCFVDCLCCFANCLILYYYLSILLRFYTAGIYFGRQRKNFSAEGKTLSDCAMTINTLNWTEPAIEPQNILNQKTFELSSTVLVWCRSAAARISMLLHSESDHQGALKTPKGSQQPVLLVKDTKWRRAFTSLCC